MATETTTCYRHPDRRAGVACQRCDQPICPSCMNAASVGFHCPQCTQQGRQRVYTAQSLGSWAGRPVVTQALIALNLIVFVGPVLVGDNPTSSRTGLTTDGGLFGPLVDDGEWWRIFTSGFLHSGVIHLGFNMLILWMLGQMLEPALGRAGFTAVYVTSLLAGSFGVLLADPLALTVGASGAVFGLMGAAIAGQRHIGVSPWESGIGGLVLLNLVITFAVPNISIGGHLGGLIGGLVAGGLFFEIRARTKSAIAPLAMLLVVDAALIAGCLWAAGQWMSRL